MKVDLRKDEIETIISSMSFDTNFLISHAESIRGEIKTIKTEWEQTDKYQYKLEYDYIGGIETEEVDIRDKIEDLENTLAYIGLNKFLIEKLKKYLEKDDAN